MTTIIFKTPVFSSKTFDASNIQGYIDDFFALIPEGIEFSVDTLPDMLSPRVFLSEIFSSLTGSGSKIISFLSLLLVWVMLCYISSSLTPDDLKSSSVISLIFALPILEVLSKIALSLIESLRQLSVFFSSAIPLLSLIDLASGTPTASKTQAVQMTVVSALINHLSVNILAPLAVAMLALAVTASFEVGFCSSLISSMKTLFTKVLSFISVVVGILFSLQSVIAVAADSAAIRLAKFSAQSMIPQIGGLVSSSLSALGAGLSYAKGIIGAGAIYVILIIFLSPLPILLAYRLCLSFAESLAKALSVPCASSAISAFVAALDSLLSVYALSSLLSLLEIILFLKTAVPIV